MAYRITAPMTLFASASLTLLGCPPPRTPPVAMTPRPPDPAVLALSPIRVTRAAWNNPSAAPMPAAPTGRGSGRQRVAAMSPEIAQPILVAANEPVRACYKGLLAFSPQAGGTITTLMRVVADGSVADVEPVGATDPSLLIMMPCVLNAVRIRRFPATRGSTLMSFPFTLRNGEVGASASQTTMGEATRPRPGEMPIVNPEAITVRPWRPTLVPNTNPVRTLTRDMAAEATPDITSLVDTCYAAASVMVPGIAGQFTLRLAVEPSGNVSRVEVQDQGAFQGPFRECLTVLGNRLKFHSSGGGAVVSAEVSVAQTGAPDSAAAGAPTGPMPMPAGAGFSGPTGAPGATIGSPSGGLMPLVGAPR